MPAGQVRFGFAGKGLWGVLDQLRCGEPVKGVIPVHPALMAEIKFYGRHKGGSIRDGVLLGLIAVIAALVRVLERPDHATSLCVGPWLALAGAIMILLGAWLSLRDERTSLYPPISPQRRPAP